MNRHNRPTHKRFTSLYRSLEQAADIRPAPFLFVLVLALLLVFFFHREAIPPLLSFVVMVVTLLIFAGLFFALDYLLIKVRYGDRTIDELKGALRSEVSEKSELNRRIDTIRPYFISYSHQDKDFAERLCNELHAEGLMCWLDKQETVPGRNISDHINGAILLSRNVLLCCSKASLTSWWVDQEIEIAFEKERRLMKEKGKKIPVLIPLDLDGYLLSDEWESGKAPQLRSRFAADFTGWKSDDVKFTQTLKELVRALTDNEN